RSFAENGYPEVNLLLAEPIIVVNLPGRSFVALDTKLGWSFVGDTFIPLMKGIAGIYVNRQRSLSISAWYQSTLSKEAEAQTFELGVGRALGYFCDWKGAGASAATSRSHSCEATAPTDLDCALRLIETRRRDKQAGHRGRGRRGNCFGQWSGMV